MPEFLTSAILLLSATFAALGAGCGIVSLLLHWKRPVQHPETTRLMAEIEQLRSAQLDILDRVEHWMKRDRVRRARQGAEAARGGAEDEIDAPAGDRKAQLRQKFYGKLVKLPGMKREGGEA